MTSILRRRRDRARPIAATIVALALGATLTACSGLDDGAYDLPLPGGADVGSDPSTLTVHFSSVEGLVPKSNVKMDNVAVGRVESIDVDRSSWTAVAKVKVRGDLDLPADVQARVRRSSLLGEWYVELVRPDDATGVLPAGTSATIPLARTGGTAQVEDVLGALSMLLNNGGLPQINSIISELNRALDGNESQVRALLGDLSEFTGRLDARRDDIVTALDRLSTLSRTLRTSRADISTALDEIPQGLKVLADERPQLVRMLRSLDRLSSVAVRVVEQSKDDTVADLEALRPVLRALEVAGDDLPEALKLLVTFPFTPAARDAVQGDYVNLDTKVDLDLASVLGTLTASKQPINLGGQDLPNPLPLLQQPSDLLGQITGSITNPLLGLLGGATSGVGQGGTTGSSTSGTGSGGLLGGLLGGGGR